MKKYFFNIFSFLRNLLDKLRDNTKNIFYKKKVVRYENLELNILDFHLHSVFEFIIKMMRFPFLKSIIFTT